MEEKVTLQLTLEEVKLVFKALGKLPFAEVYEVIGEINKQVNEQVSEQDDDEMYK